MTLLKGRIALVLAVVLAVVLGAGVGAAHLWTSHAAAAAPSAPAGPPRITAYASGTPDTIRITITHVADGAVFPPPTPTTRTVVDRTFHDAALATHLQHELATMPLVADPGSPSSCQMGSNTYDTYTLTWYRAGLPVEQAAASPGDGCGFWKATTAGGEALYLPFGVPLIYADIDRAVGRTPPTPPPSRPVPPATAATPVPPHLHTSGTPSPTGQ